jgi:hypothetical protein
MSEATYWDEHRVEFCALAQQLSPDDALLVLRTLCDECSDERAVLPTLVGLVTGSVQRRLDEQRWQIEGGRNGRGKSNTTK